MANPFVIQLPNRPGALADPSEILAARAVSLSSTTNLNWAWSPHRPMNRWP